MKNKGKPVMTMLTPGRRALGEKWSKVRVFADPDAGGYTVEREDSPAPADNTPILVPQMGEVSVEMADYILEYKRQDQEYRVRRGNPIRKTWTHKEINQLWFDWCEFKKKHYLGQSVSGPGGWTQRDRINRR